VPDFGAFTLLGAEIIDPNNDVTFPNAQQFGLGTISFNASTLPAGSGGYSMTGSVLGGVNPSVTNSTTETVLMDPGFQSGMSSTSMEYYFEVVGPSLTAVPVDIVANLSDSWSSNLSSGGGFSDSAQLGVYDLEGNQIQGWEIGDQGGTSGGETLAVDQTMDLMSDTIYNVFEGTNATIQLGFGSEQALDGTYSTSVSIDPLITIDPSFLLPGYSVALSPNLTSPVPDTESVLGLLAFSVFVLAVLLGTPSAIAKRC
jgi:hypothetical protein